MTYDEKWSYTYEQIEEYVMSCGAKKAGPCGPDASYVCRYILPDCEVTLEALPDRPMGNLVFPNTRIRIEGPGADSFYHGFRLRFISGGG